MRSLKNNFQSLAYFFVFEVYQQKMKRVMKKITLSAMVLAFAVAFSACNNTKTEDSKEVAEEQNDANWTPPRSKMILNLP